MLVKPYLNEVILTAALAFMVFYPPIAGVFLYALTLSALAGFRYLDHLHTRDDDKTQAQINEIKAQVERMLLSRTNR